MTAIIPVLVKAVQQQQGQIQSLASDVSLTDTGQVNIGYNIDPQILASLGYNGAKNEIESANYQLFDTNHNPVTRVGQFAKLTAAKITAGLISTENLIANNIITNTTRSKSLQTAIISPLSDISNTVTVDGNLNVADNLIAQNIQTTSVTTDNLIASEATVSTLYAEDIIGKNGSFTQTMADKITALRDEIRATIAGLGATPSTGGAESTPSALVADSYSWAATAFDAGTTQVSLNGSFSLTDNLVVGSKLTVIGNSQLGNAFITGTLTAGQIAIKDNLIETTNSALFIQPSGLGQVDIMNHTLIIADNGEVTINGNLSLNGNLTAQTATISGLTRLNQVETVSLFGNLISANEISTKKLTADVINVATDSASVIIADSNSTPIASSSAALSSNATAGTATLPAGKTELVITNPTITSSSMVYLTPVGSTNNQVVYLKSKFVSPTPSPTDQSTFTIALDQPLATDININWWIIN
jgi:hypothetical protein